MLPAMAIPESQNCVASLPLRQGSGLNPKPNPLLRHGRTGEAKDETDVDARHGDGRGGARDEQCLKPQGLETVEEKVGHHF